MDWTEIEREALLDAGVALRDYETAEGGEDRKRFARLAIGHLVEALCAKVGPDVLADAWGLTPDERDAKARLECLADRVALFAPPVEALPERGLCLKELEAEFRATALGDKAQITNPAPFHGLKHNNAIRLSYHRLRALQWDAFLAAHGNKPAARHNAVAVAYGEDWTTVYRWKSSVVSALGDDAVRIALRSAECRLTAVNRVFPFTTPEAVSEALAFDGAAYKRERRRMFDLVA